MEEQQEPPKSLGEASKSLGEAPKSLGEAPKSLGNVSNGEARKTEGGTTNLAPTSLGAISNDDSRSVEGTPKQRKTSIFGSENFLAKLESKIQDNQLAHDELVKTKFETVKADIKEYFNRVIEQVHRQIADTRDAILDKIEMIIENESGYLDWESFKEEAIRKKEEYEKAPDIAAQKQAFDSYFEFYNNMNTKIDAINNKSYARLDNTSKIFKFDEIVLDKFIMSFQSLCSVLESDFVTSVSFVTGHLDPTKMRLDELVQIPHQGVSCSPEKLDEFDTFVLGGRDGRVSMYDAKSMRVLDVIQGLNEIVNCLLYIPQHNILLIGGSEPKIIARRVEGRNLGKHLSHLDAGGSVSFLVFMEDQNLIASVGSDSNIRLYNPNSLVMVSKIPTTKKGSLPKGGACYFKDKKLLVVGFDDGTLQFYSMKTKQMVFGLFTESKVYSGLIFNEPSGRLIAHTKPGIIKIWTFKGDRPADESDITLDGEGDKACNIQMTGRYLLSASNNEKVVVYDMEDMKLVKKIDLPGFKVQGLLVLEKEGKIIASDEHNAKIACIRLH